MIDGHALLDVYCTPPRVAPLDGALKGLTLQDWAFEGLTLRRAVGAGGGPYVLVLHGWGSGGQHMLGLARAIARAGATPVVVDFPAHGASAGATTTMLQCGAVVRALIAQFQPMGICAHSFGAMAAALVLSGHAHFGGVQQSGIKLAMVSPGYSVSWMTQRHCREHGLSEQEQAALKAAMNDRYGAGVTDIHMASAARALPDSTHIFHDEDDTIIDIAEIRKIAALSPYAALTVTQGNGHDKILLDRTILRSVAAFFQTDPAV